MSEKKYTKPWSILIAIGLAIVIGSLINKETTFLGINLYAVFNILGMLFLNALTLVVVPLVSSSIITGVAGMASEAQFGRLGLKTFAIFLFSNFVAILIGSLVCNLVQPGSGVEFNPNQVASLENLQTAKEGNFSNLILEIVPANILAAFAKGNMLGLIFFSLLFGYAITHTKPAYLQTHMQFWKGIFEAILYIVHGILKLLPIGVFCLTVKIFADVGVASLRPLAHFFWAVLVGLILFGLIFIPLLLKLVARIPVIAYFRALSPAIVTAFSTASSSATLPISLDCMERRVGVSNKICSLVIPLGTSLNLSGTALYNTMAVLFISQVFGVEFTLLNQIALIFTTLLLSFGVASIPGGGLVVILTIFRIFGLPIEGIGLLLALDRIIDMFRTTTNLLSYTTSATLIAKSEGENQLLKMAK